MGLNRIILIFALFGLGTPLAAAPISSRQSGPWSDPLTWQRNGNPSDNVVPTAGDTVTIQTGHAVTMDAAAAQAGAVTVSGTLAFDRSASTTLTIIGGHVTVAFGGLLDMGTDLSPIPSGVTARLFLARGNGATRYGLILPANGGVFTSRGADKSPVALALTDAGPGATSLQVPAASAAGWAPGDLITVGQTERTVPFQNQTEERTILSITGTNPKTVSWSGGLSYTHAAAAGIRVANLTRNVVVRSSGTTLSSDTAFLLVNNGPPQRFRAVQTEFAFLGGVDPTDHAGVSFAGDAVEGSASSCTFHHGWRGFRSNSLSPVTLQGNVFFANGTNVQLINALPTRLVSNEVIASSVGPGVEGAAAELVSNAFYSNAGDGARSGALLTEGNLAFANGAQGIRTILLDGSYVAFNEAYRNTSVGLGFELSQGHLVEGNEARENGSTGMGISVQNTLLFGNRTMGNLSHGLSQEGPSGGNRLFSHASGANVEAGLNVESQPFFLQDVSLGYDAAGAPAPNGTTNLRVSGTSAQLRGCRLLTGPAFLGTSSALSYNQDFATGTVRVYGSHAFSAGQSLVLDNALPLYASSATAPRVVQGAGNVLTVLSTDDSTAVSQVITVKYEGAQWLVSGTVSGALGVYMAPARRRASASSP
jgi:hypothetical protein